MCSIDSMEHHYKIWRLLSTWWQQINVQTYIDIEIICRCFINQVNHIYLFVCNYKYKKDIITWTLVRTIMMDPVYQNMCSQQHCWSHRIFRIPLVWNGASSNISDVVQNLSGIETISLQNEGKKYHVSFLCVKHVVWSFGCLPKYQTRLQQ